MKARYNLILKYLDSIQRTVQEETRLDIIRQDVLWNVERIIEVLEDVRKSPDE